MNPRILILNGPNLNLLATREPEIYGTTSLKEIEEQCRTHAASCSITFSQSNDEATIIDAIQNAITKDKQDAIIINAAALTHSSIAILDALQAFTGIVVEVHLSNIFRREEFRSQSYISLRANGIICGFGAHGYLLALDAVQKMLLSQEIA